MAQRGDRLGDRYELLEPIGSGGMATVWRARDRRLRRTVAVKILRPQFAEDPEFVARFESEARHAASLAHPNVAAVYDTGFDAGPDGGTRYIVMELVDGPTVADLLRDGPLRALRAVDIAVAAARALAAAHRRGIVHRDVKPGNLLIGSDGRVRLADFGIARALTSSRLTTAGAMFGSAPYMSPEQARGEEALAPSDIYSLGVVLHEMLVGGLPDRSGLPADGAVSDGLFGAAGPVIPELPAGLGSVLSRALQADPEARYPSARVFADALESAARRLRRRVSVGRPWPNEGGTNGPIEARLPRTRKGRPLLSPPPRPVVAGGGVEPGLASGQGAPGMAALATTRFVHASQGQSGGLGGLGSRPLARQRDTRRRRAAPLPLLVGSALIAGALVIAIAVLNLGARSLGGVLSATATPPSVAIVSPSPTATLSSSPQAAVSASASPSPDASPTQTPAPRPTPAVKPAPTSRPTPPPTAERPTTAVVDFYDAVEHHDWDRAVARWSERMRRRYPPDEWLIGRFSRTTRIDIDRLSQVALNSARGTATVAVTLTEYRTVEPSPRTFSGTWDLVRVEGRWLLDEPHF